MFEGLVYFISSFDKETAILIIYNTIMLGGSKYYGYFFFIFLFILYGAVLLVTSGIKNISCIIKKEDCFSAKTLAMLILFPFALFYIFLFVLNFAYMIFEAAAVQLPYDEGEYPRQKINKEGFDCFFSILFTWFCNLCFYYPF